MPLCVRDERFGIHTVALCTHPGVVEETRSATTTNGIA